MPAPAFASRSLEKPARQVGQHDDAKRGHGSAEHMVDTAHDAVIDVAMKNPDNRGHGEPPQSRTPDHSKYGHGSVEKCCLATRQTAQTGKQSGKSEEGCRIRDRERERRCDRSDQRPGPAVAWR